MFLIKKTILSLCALMTCSISAKVANISNEDDYNKTLKGSPRVLVKFSADWCSVCNGIQKPFEEIANESEFQNVTFAQVDVDKLDGVSKQNGIVGVPTFVYVENGNKKVEEIGVQNMPTFKEHLRDNLRKNFVAEQENAQLETTPQVEEALLVEETATIPVSPVPVAEPNFFVRLFTMIRDFIMAVILKIKDFFVTIIDAIKGFFG